MPINIDGSKGIRQNTTEVTKIPVGTTAQRPANPEAGMIRLNTDRGFVEWYDDVGDVWNPTSFSTSGVVATGGTVTDIEQGFERYRVHAFTSDGTFTAVRGGNVDVLIVAGGGGGGAGGSSQGGGGGAGGLIFEESFEINSQNYTITVGQGGTRGIRAGEQYGRRGDNSSAFNFIAIGGGGGIYSGGGDEQKDGGSGGGTSNLFFESAGTGITNQGNDGGDGSDEQGGGGGGAGTAGSSPGNGGFGLDFSSIFSSNFGQSGRFAGGGGGARTDGSAHLGRDGGGNGGVGGSGSNGTNNTGGGGGGGTGSNDGGNGGSGIVIVRYRIG